MKLRQHGYSLIELIVVIGIIALLASLAFPSYTAYVQRGNRSDATRALMQYAQAFERCYSSTFDYSKAACTPTLVPVASVSANGYYNIALTAISATDYTLTATPAGPPQNADTLCTSFTLSASAGQTATGAAANPSQFCWGSN